ncbi:hypothetical protein B2J93_2079 [Marssonina coronariae]|uniref:DUF1748-domain-containing protein n=1 Tax=Diplocarpon coronariae TaxID=2795749 RepID=A0A218Z7N1_9HELO|nr:hypothetical protein JHW43_008554 [Diplocarpon mali]OWP04071.1 hypothetical protein B2J93_2079 [Marssonina coronariae]
MVFLNLLTLGLWGKLGRLTHYAFDAVLFSAFLAGMKRSTGLTYVKTQLIPSTTRASLEQVALEQALYPYRLPSEANLTNQTHIGDLRPSFKKDSITENKDINVWIDKYLGVGEWVMDQSVAIAGSSGWFERKR